MRVAIFGDVHWSQNSSIVRSHGSEYSVRLENLIRSMNWMEHCAFDHGCQAIICLGDFFDESIPFYHFEVDFGLFEEVNGRGFKVGEGL